MRSLGNRVMRHEERDYKLEIEFEYYKMDQSLGLVHFRKKIFVTI
jgi:hypothetical protein